MATRAEKAAATARATADAWNAKHPVGTVVRYWKMARRGAPSGEGPTRSPAEARGEDAVVFIEGCSGFVCLTHVEVAS